MALCKYQVSKSEVAITNAGRGLIYYVRSSEQLILIEIG